MSSYADRSSVAVVLIAFLVILGLSTLALSWLEDAFFTTNAQPTVVEIKRLDGTDPGDQTSLTRFRYVVGLPDGTEAVLVSERVFRVGTRVQGSTSRNRVTGKTVVTGP